MRIPSKWVPLAGAIAVAVSVGALFYGYRSFAVWDTASSVQDQIHYLIESGGTIGEVPASEAFDVEYLGSIFGDNPSLYDQLNSLFEEGLTDKPALNLGEVAAMIVTYRAPNKGDAEDVVAHVIGDFPLGERRPGFHRDGYFSAHLDEGLWSLGDTMISFVGRDMILFGEEQAIEKQRELLQSITRDGEIGMLVDHLSNTVHYTAVFPDPKRIVPARLKKHVRAVVVKGSLGHTEGDWECIVLTSSPQAAKHTLNIAKDCNKAAIIALKTKWRGYVRDTAWGPHIDPWWAYELVNNLENISVSNDQNLVRMKLDFKRVMVNVVLKAIERAGRDMSKMSATLGEKMDPRLVDAQLKSQKPLHYWSTAHKWGPHWPIGPDGPNAGVFYEKKEEPPPAPEESIETAPVDDATI